MAIMPLSRSGTVPDHVPRIRDDVSGTAGRVVVLNELSTSGVAVTSTAGTSLAEQRIKSELADLLKGAKHATLAAMASQFAVAMATAAFGFGIVDIPPMTASEDDDGTILIEWIFRDRRIGLTFDNDPAQSGWHFISGSGGSHRLRMGKLDLGPAALARMALSVA
jgi:hypothetical protein